MSAGELPRLHIVTDDLVLRTVGFSRAVEDVLSTGGHRIALHLRGRSLRGLELWEIARRCARIATRTDSLLLINDRLDVALAVGAGGAQLGGSSFPVAVARRLLGPGRLVGASVHGIGEARSAMASGADFLVAGTLYQTSSHPDRSARGVGWLRQLRGMGKPVIGIGGITPARVGEVRNAGAYGVAVISGVWATNRPAHAVTEYLEKLG